MVYVFSLKGCWWVVFSGSNFFSFSIPIVFSACIIFSELSTDLYERLMQNFLRRDVEGVVDPHGSVWGIPYRWGSLVFAFRKDKLEKNGIAPIRVRYFTSLNPDVFCFLHPLNSDWPEFISLLHVILFIGAFSISSVPPGVMPF